MIPIFNAFDMNAPPLSHSKALYSLYPLLYQFWMKNYCSIFRSAFTFFSNLPLSEQLIQEGQSVNLLRTTLGLAFLFPDNLNETRIKPSDQEAVGAPHRNFKNRRQLLSGIIGFAEPGHMCNKLA